MALRIIAGRAHGRRLRVPGGPTRPTSSLVRGALFNMLEHRGWLANTSLVDFYAGSGALGIEALSRGARAVVFVETSATVLRTLRDNLAASGYPGRAEVIGRSAERARGGAARRRHRGPAVRAGLRAARGRSARRGHGPRTRGLGCRRARHRRDAGGAARPGGGGAGARAPDG